MKLENRGVGETEILLSIKSVPFYCRSFQVRAKKRKIQTNIVYIGLDFLLSHSRNPLTLQVKINDSVKPKVAILKNKDI